MDTETRILAVLLFSVILGVSRNILNSLDFVVNRFFMKLFQINDMDIIKCCQS